MQCNAECRHVASGARNVMTADNSQACPHCDRGTGVIFARTRPRIRHTDSGKLRSRSQLSSSNYFCDMAERGQGRIFFSSRCYWIRWKSFTFQRKIWNVNSPDSISIYLEEAPPRRSDYRVDFSSWTLTQTVFNMHVRYLIDTSTAHTLKLWMWINWTPKKYH